MEVFFENPCKDSSQKVYIYIQYITTLRKTLINTALVWSRYKESLYILSGGGHPLRCVTLCSELLQNLSGTPLVIDDFAIWFSKTLRTSLAICDFAI